jgi:transposase-like protein
MANAIGEAVRSLAEEEEQTLTFYQFPETMHRYIRTTNAIESLFIQSVEKVRTKLSSKEGHQAL